MQKGKVLPILGTMMIVTAAVCTYAFPRLPVPSIHKIPVETFPRTIGEWQAGPDEPVDPEVQAKIPTAKIVSRVYKNSAGQTVELTLLSASVKSDFHDPNLCFPAHGWELSNHRAVRFQEDRFDEMTAVQEGTKMEVLYKWLSTVSAQPPANVVLRTSYKIREEMLAHGMMDRQDGMSVFVRVMARRDSSSQRALNDFVPQILPTIKSIMCENGS